MANKNEVDLEGQRSENVILRPDRRHGEQPVTDIGSKSDPDGLATQHSGDSIVGPHGTPEYYQYLVKLALRNSQLDIHGLSFDFLHRLVLLDHQSKLAHYSRTCIKNSKTTNPEIADISNSLHEYTKATVDYMFWRDKKEVHLDSKVRNAASQALNPRSQNYAKPPDLYELLIPEVKEIQDLNGGIVERLRYCNVGSKTDQGPQCVDESITRRQSDTAQVLNHFAMAFVGGLSLIVPVLIMALHRSRVTSLVVTSVAVTLFAIVLAIWPLVSRHFPWRKDTADLAGADEVLENKDVLTATAAYAAVLVVFVGASLSTVQ